MNANAAGAPGAETRGHAPGETSPTSERDAQQLTGPALRFGLTGEAEALRGEPAWERFDRNAKTLVKDGGFRVVLTALKAGAALDEHRVTARVMVQTVRGHLRLHLSAPDAVVLDLPTGHLAVLQPGITHRVEAVEESAFLLTVAGLAEESVEAEAR
jgi:quercetin dioxygenase-like cupin family protein